MTLTQYIRATTQLGLPRRGLVLMLIISIATALIESLGLAMVVPIYDFITANGQLDSLPKTGYWAILQNFAVALDVRVSLAFLLSIAFGAVLLRQIGSYARQMVVAQSRERVTKAVRDALFRRYLDAGLGEQESLKSGELVNSVTNELQRFNSSLVGLVSLFNAAIMGVVYGGVLLWTSWQMTAVALAVVVVSMWPLRVIYRRVAQAGQAATVANVAATEFLVERLAPARLIRLSRSEAAETARMDHFTARQRQTMIRLDRLMALSASVIEPIILGLVFLLIYFAIEFVSIQMASLAIFLMVVLRLLPVAKDVMKGRQLILAGAASTVALQQMMQRLEQAAEGAGGPHLLPRLRQSVVFRNVSFYYPNASRAALDCVNLSIPAGSLTAIVGPSGSGKSTLIDLLPGLRRPTGGQIFFDGRPLSEFNFSSLRASIAYVPQTAQIYGTTVAEHIRLGCAEASDDDIRAAAALAGANDFINKLPQGLATRLGQGGGGLSGGQRQRLDLARAIASRATLLILDEPTSALDAESEQDFVASLRRLRTERPVTILVVTHRMALIRDAKQIAVLRDGKVDAFGDFVNVQQNSVWFANAISSYFENRAEASEPWYIRS